MRSIQLFFITFSLLFSINLLSAQSFEINNCDKAKNKMEEAYILLHKVYTSKGIDLAKKDLNQALKIVNVAKKEMEKCPCQLAENITNDIAQDLKKYKSLNDLEDLHGMAKMAMLQSRDAMLELRNDKLAQF